MDFYNRETKDFAKKNSIFFKKKFKFKFKFILIFLFLVVSLTTRKRKLHRIN